ncbi:sensor histidine kinase [Flavilitoribacter nigricans]|uniref:histidine kinase n=1 Tax=Flavilitoribacter nigricans (strain ATCC 23147 / DSM 23189 / NBRC 102662 / NCIMB 1420 / SS-2) TaxID=1122177 RepID=A0A2D0NE62_FLAN2|nr:ATP-binding protein [Flavilitoribacter nigricans]PHN06757.1 ATP-binding protein [Flavilitoribacter nigricans DSM 23189 = NBRC 102662]
MISKPRQWPILRRILPLLLLTALITYLISIGGHWSLFLLFPLGAYQFWELLRYHRLPMAEWRQFIESVKYRDFSRHFDEESGTDTIREMRNGFNRLNVAFQDISKEKEAQFHFLQKILELIDTGILSYEEDSGEVSWMNETWKEMLMMPHLRRIDGLKKRNERLYREIQTLRAGESKVVRMQLEQAVFKVMLTATQFVTEGRTHKLIACKNVNDALDAAESKAWQQLLGVLTHEIMNSIAPISSLADTLKRQIQQSKAQSGATALPVDDLELGVATIQNRGEGLLKFARTYSQLNKINNLQLEQVYVHSILENIAQLMEPGMLQKGIEMQLILKDPDLQIMADTNLLEQALINLLVNATEAVRDVEEARIVLSAYRIPSGKTIIKVADNGKGIPEALWDKIFIPFFSSRKTGSGIGLSLCKQIMLLHGGNIQVQSVEGEGTAFLLYF